MVYIIIMLHCTNLQSLTMLGEKRIICSYMHTLRNYFILRDMLMYPVPRHERRTVLPSDNSSSFFAPLAPMLLLPLSSSVPATSFILNVTPKASRSSRNARIDWSVSSPNLTCGNNNNEYSASPITEELGIDAYR
jgi:hypothetical protein